MCLYCFFSVFSIAHIQVAHRCLTMKIENFHTVLFSLCAVCCSVPLLFFAVLFPQAVIPNTKTILFTYKLFLIGYKTCLYFVELRTIRIKVPLFTVTFCRHIVRKDLAKVHGLYSVFPIDAILYFRRFSLVRHLSTLSSAVTPLWLSGVPHGCPRRNSTLLFCQKFKYGNPCRVSHRLSETGYLFLRQCMDSYPSCFTTALMFAKEYEQFHFYKKTDEKIFFFHQFLSYQSFNFSLDCL